ncbi:hypothetical protein LFL96_21070 [Paraburkholderia sp. D15]|uniref:hypothetical protein n=1 Tax=Paraburkholderia sp. D15 TaxID=2880218 RepID=UPI00247A0DE1|nr:hypothetical protein [Paraburkholderia sp. D15]WGS53553.1 hypothetical protein LFL96_21070 [Paraburkholderia sp. D15]
MNSHDPIIRDQAKVIREQAEQKPAPRKETPREGRYRVERERAAADLKRNPHKGY